MRRDVRLHGLSSDHSHALALMRRIQRCLCGEEPEGDVGAVVGQVFDSDLEPHFRIEEEVLLPELTSSATSDLVQRTLAEHQLIRRLIAGARLGQLDALRALAYTLDAHIRFEERELYPTLEAVASDAALARAAVCAPKPEIEAQTDV